MPPPEDFFGSSKSSSVSESDSMSGGGGGGSSVRSGSDSSSESDGSGPPEEPMDYTVVFALGWPAGEGYCPDLNLYVKAGDGGPVVYPGNLTGGGLVMNYDAYPNGDAEPAPPEVTSGGFISAGRFYAWFNQHTNIDPQVVIGITFAVTIYNNSTTQTIYARRNGGSPTAILPGTFLVVGLDAYAGYGTGDQSGFTDGDRVDIDPS